MQMPPRFVMFVPPASRRRFFRQPNGQTPALPLLRRDKKGLFGVTTQGSRRVDTSSSSALDQIAQQLLGAAALHGVFGVRDRYLAAQFQAQQGVFQRIEVGVHFLRHPLHGRSRSRRGRGPLRAARCALRLLCRMAAARARSPLPGPACAGASRRPRQKSPPAHPAESIFHRRGAPELFPASVLWASW